MIQLPTDEQVAAYLSAKGDYLKSKAPGYSCIFIERRNHRESETTFRVYTDNGGWIEDVTMDAAIAKALKNSSGQRAIDLKRVVAARLLAEADALEAAAK